MGFLGIPSRWWTFMAETFWDFLALIKQYIIETITQLWKQILRAFGLDASPEEQMFASALLIPVAIGSSLLSGGATLLFVALFVVTFLVGLARLAYQGARFILLDEGSPE